MLSAQYESWGLPLAVILIVPMCLLCSVVGVLIARMDVNIFTQIGLVVLVGNLDGFVEAFVGFGLPYQIKSNFAARK